MEPNIWAVIMAGGKGTRFWPASREKKPKQLLAITGPNPMIRTTADRVAPLVPPERTLVVTGRAHAEGIRAALPGLPPENIVVEPVGRNTAPCIGLAAGIVRRRDPHGVMLVMPADHVIEKESVFLNLARAGAELAARDGRLVTLGITPTRPETGFGYIEAGAPAGEARGAKAFDVVSFHEKPDLDTARGYLERGVFSWNSGIFIWSAETILDWIDRLLPELARGLEPLGPAWTGPDFDRLMAEVYPGLPSVSIDYGVMEKAEGVLVMPADMGWNDVGSWSSAAGYWPEQEGGLRVQGKVLSVDSSDCAVYGSGRLVTLLGVEGLIVVDTPDALMICSASRDQDVRRIVDLLEKEGQKDLL